ncbi:MAG TPA: HD domain-containing phosphohydrolase [Burkholderiales bacterium]|nr:HD domain-containing phosphohydrolase [Burkholderiales bacterium]
MNKIKVAIHELKPGMFVCELDRPWLETPYLLQGVYISGAGEIEELARYCRFVYVDPEKSQRDVAARLRAGSGNSIAPDHLKAPRYRHPNAVEYKDTATVEQELGPAKEIRANIRDLLTNLEQDIRSDRVLDRERLSEAVENMTDSIIRNPDALFLLTKLREADNESYGRALDVAIYVLAFGRHLGFPKAELQTMGMGGLLLDVGKTRLPHGLLAKRGPLSGEEHKLMKTHVQHSMDILAKSQWVPRALLDMVLTHHERQDGSGYPRGLRGPQIGIYGKIAGIADCYEDLTTQQPFAPALAPSAALRVLEEWKARLFQEDLIEEFIQCIGMYPVGSLVELNTGEVAVVMSNNRVHRLKPRVMALLDPRKQRLREPLMLDLGAATRAGGPEVAIAQGLQRGAFGINPAEYYL